MATNTGHGFRRGVVTDRSQFRTSTGWVKRGTRTGQILDRKADARPFKGVRKEK